MRAARAGVVGMFAYDSMATVMPANWSVTGGRLQNVGPQPMV